MTIMQYIYCSWNKHPHPFFLQLQTCNLINKSKTLMAQEAALQRLSVLVDSFDAVLIKS